MIEVTREISYRWGCKRPHDVCADGYTDMARRVNKLETTAVDLWRDPITRGTVEACHPSMNERTSVSLKFRIVNITD